MRIEPASNLGNTCEYLGLDEEGRVSFDPLPCGVAVWDLKAEKLYVATWVMTAAFDFRTQDWKPEITVSNKAVPERVKAIIEDEFLRDRAFCTPHDRETIESELEYRAATGRPQGDTRGVRELSPKI
jgi:hypothetical protein